MTGKCPNSDWTRLETFVIASIGEKEKYNRWLLSMDPLNDKERRANKKTKILPKEGEWKKENDKTEFKLFFIIKLEISNLVLRCFCLISPVKGVYHI